jgi:hypothetical protein
MRTLIARVLLFIVLASSLSPLACSGAPAAPSIPGAPEVELSPALLGIPDHGNDPAVVLLEAPGMRCTGALIDEDVVLTARRCVELVTRDTNEGPRDLTTVRVLVGDATGTAIERARGRSVIMPTGGGSPDDDIAFLLLDAAIDDVTQLTVSPTGAALGDHVRSVAYGAGVKVVRDHVPVTAVSGREIALGEAPCIGSAGGALIDEVTGDLVGVVSHGAPRCGDDHGWDVATRPDAFFNLVERALAAGHVSHATHRAKEKKGPIDVGATCDQPDQCAAGACVSFAGATYCSRLCSPTDRCPSKFRCMQSSQSTTICVQE